MSETPEPEGTYVGEADAPGFVEAGSSGSEATYVGEADAPGFTGDAAAHAAYVAAHDLPIEHDEAGDAIVALPTSAAVGIGALGHSAIDWVAGEGVLAAGEIAMHEHHVPTEETSHGAEEVLGDPYGGTLPPGGAPAGIYIGEADDPDFVHGGNANSEDADSGEGTYIGEADDPDFVHGGSGTMLPAGDGEPVPSFEKGGGTMLPTDDGVMPPGDLGYIADAKEGS